MNSIRGGVVQFQHRANDKTHNLSIVAHLSEQAASRGVRILAFPEMCITGYWHVRNLCRRELDLLAEPIPGGPSSAALAALASKYEMAIGAGLIERANSGELFNSYLVVLPDGSWHCHRKLHAFESEHFRSGQRFTVFNTPWNVRVGILTCWDNNLVENARATALLGADVLMAPHQTGGCVSRSPHAMGPIDPSLWREREVNPAAIEAEFRGPDASG